MRVPHGEKILAHLLGLYENSTPLKDFKKQCVDCGGDVMEADDAQEVQELEDGPEEQGTQEAQDINHG